MVKVTWEGRSEKSHRQVIFQKAVTSATGEQSPWGQHCCHSTAFFPLSFSGLRKLGYTEEST